MIATRFTELFGLEHPIASAPMALHSGGALAAAVTEAGGLGLFGGVTREGPGWVTQQADLVRARTDRPFGIGFITAFIEMMSPLFDAALTARPEVVALSFGDPSPYIPRARDIGAKVLCQVQTLQGADDAIAAGADVLVVQGVEAGAHRASFRDRDDAEGLGVLPLIRLVSAELDLPLVAAGGIADGASVAAVLAAGASAAQIGTGFLRAAEAGTHPVHRAALAADAPTALTRAFSGRLARGLVNRFLTEHGNDAPFAYPHVHFATAPIRAAAREQGDAEGFNLWAGQAHRLARELPAAEIVETLAREARTALAAAEARLDRR